MTLNQWHKTNIYEEGWKKIFRKNYKPYSYEINNEISWLTSSILRENNYFKIPKIIDFSIKNWFVDMEYINTINNIDIYSNLKRILIVATEIHNKIISNKPYLRTELESSTDYIPYLIDYTRLRIDNTLNFFNISKDILDKTLQNINSLKVSNFWLVHRDFRLRHFLNTEWMPFLIDWEFSNISDTTQDLSKIIYDLCINYEQNFEKVLNFVLDNYYSNISKDELENKIIIFLPIIIFENTSSLVIRKPKWYIEEVEKNLSFLNYIYEKIK